MNGDITTRQRRSKSQKPHCILCKSIVDVQRHHVGGRNHVAWFTIPLCCPHHEELTRRLRQAGVNMSYTTDKTERLRRARQAVLVFSWMLEEFEGESNHG
jgi:hypothetical protein